MAPFPPPPPRIHEEQIVCVHHDAHNNYHCPDRACPCWADEREELPEAWDALQDVPSYIEQQAAAFAKEDSVS